MDALIMAAGRGSRLGSHTDDRPKSLIDLGGISPLELQIDLLAARGVERIVLVTGYRRADVEAAAIRRAGGRLAVEAVWNPFWPVTNVVAIFVNLATFLPILFAHWLSREPSRESGSQWRLRRALLGRRLRV